MKVNKTNKQQEAYTCRCGRMSFIIFEGMIECNNCGDKFVFKQGEETYNHFPTPETFNRAVYDCHAYRTEE